MRAQLTKDYVAFSGKARDVRGMWLRLYEEYGSMRLEDYLRMCNEEQSDGVGSKEPRTPP